MEERLIVTAASASYGPAVLAMLGSLSLNWPGHPRVVVYDIGLDDATRRTLDGARIEVRQVPSFVPHWRKHFTWKFWVWSDAPARDVFYVDAAITVMRPLEDVFAAIESTGYFVVPTYGLLSLHASEAACRGCGVEPSFREGRMTIAGTLVGFRKEGVIADVLEQGLEVASTEEHVASTEPLHRHDQAVLSLLLHKQLGQPVMSDTMIYAGWLSPDQTPGQAIWTHRRRLQPADQAHYAAHVSRPGPPHRPGPPPKPRLVDRVGGRLHELRRRVQKMGPYIYDGVRD